VADDFFLAVITGEEDEDTIYSVRGKLFSLDDNSWKEKGTGLLKLNVKREDGTGARLGMFSLSSTFTRQSHLCVVFSDAKRCSFHGHSQRYLVQWDALFSSSGSTVSTS
jgi:hypothetical protein